MKSFSRSKSLHIFLLLFLVMFSLSAAEVLITSDQVNAYVIQDYAFSVQGKTKHFALRSLLVPADGDPSFPTEEDMVQALAQKKQLLINKRIFTDVDVTYSLDSYRNGVAYYTATFHVEDASTLLIVPFPKFDNDTVGLRLGVKMYDKNLFGSFGDLYVSASISQGNGGRDGWEHREDAVEIVLSALPIKKTFLNFAIDYEQVKGFPNKGKFNFDLDWYNLEIRGSKLNIAPWGEFIPTQDFTSWKPVEFGVSWKLGPFNQNENKFSLYNKLRLYSDNKKLYTLTHFDQHDLTFFSHPLTFKIHAETDAILGNDLLEYLNLGATLGTTISLPLGIFWTPAVSATIHYKPDDIPLPYSYLISNTLSKSKINWKGNFREGIEFSLNYTTDLYPQIEYKDERSLWYITNSITWFPFATKHFNPSLQFKGFLAEKGKEDYFTNTAIADLMRGYLTSTIEDMDLNILREYGMVMNLNLTTTFIDFGFAKSYASPFLDIGIFHNIADPDKPIIITSAGLDGWAIVNKYPSYPLRGSLGFNLESLRKVINKEIPLTELEFELFIGMGLHF